MSIQKVFYMYIYIYIYLHIIYCIDTYISYIYKMCMSWIIPIHAQVNLIYEIIFLICCSDQISKLYDQKDEISNSLIFSGTLWTNF